MTRSSNRKLEWLVWGGLILVIGGIVAAYFASRKSPLPVLRKVEVAFVNQLGEQVTLADLEGDIWVADIIFTRCPGPCARMTKQFSELQNVLPKEVRLVSLTADPEFDTPEVLKRYGEKYGADPNRWWFLTGNKGTLYNLAMNGLLLALEEKDPAARESEDDLFIHSTIFVLVDRKGRVRASYESTDPAIHEKILADVKKLRRER